MIYFQSLTKKDLAELLKPMNLQGKQPRGLEPEDQEKRAERRARYQAQQIFHWVYQRFVDDWDQMSDLSKELRAWLKENVTVFRLKEHVSRQALDGTHKFLWDLSDAKTIESVIIPAALQEKDEIPEEDEKQAVAAQKAAIAKAPLWVARRRKQSRRRSGRD